MPSSTIVRVNLPDRAYDIKIGAGILWTIGPDILDLLNLKHAVVITDANVEKPHATGVAESLKEYGVNVDVLVVAPGEASKSVETADQLWQQMLDRGADRKTAVVAVGGGVIGDLAGFIAATFGRGIPFVQIPTTLLAHVDSSVGGKVGINLPKAKNMVGAFWQPRGVFIDLDMLETLPAREYRSGLAEVVKYGVILDAEFFVYLEEHIDDLNQRNAEVLQYVVARCCQLKANVVEADEREETGARAVLNYGHTFAHAIEAVTGYGEFLHGEAVSIGMLCASRLAEKLGRLNEELTIRQHRLLSAIGLPVRPPDASRDQLINAMYRDKKTEHGQLRFVLPSRLGHVELVSDVSLELVRASLDV